jgi:hypothetical protein
MAQKNEDTYSKTIKMNLQSILRKNVDYSVFLECITKANNIYFMCSNFINCYVLYCFKNDYELPLLNYDFIRMAFKSLSKKTCGPSVKGYQLDTLNDLNDFFEKEFIFISNDIDNKKLKKLIDDKKKEDKNERNKKKKKFTKEEEKKAEINSIENVYNDYKYDSTHLSYIIHLFAKEMEIAYKNNVILNFFKYVEKYVNQFFIIHDVKKMPSDEFRKLNKDKQTEHRNNLKLDQERIKKIRIEIRFVKDDLINNTLKSDKKYHKWIKEHKKIIFPEMEEKIKIKTYTNDIKINHNKYIFHMLQMNQTLEENEKKLFTCIPLRTNIKNKYVHFDTSVLKDIFNEITLKKRTENIEPQKTNEEIKKEIREDNINRKIGFIKINEKNKPPKTKECILPKKTNEEIWSKYFNINLNKNKIKNYSFNHQISTNGYDVSINFINNAEIEGKKRKIKAMCDGSRNSKKITNGLKDEIEYKEFKDDKKKKDLNKKIENVNIKDVEKKKKQEEYKKLPKEEQEQIKRELKLMKNKYEYIEDAIEDEDIYNELKRKHKLKLLKVIDPGKREPLNILGTGNLNLMKETKQTIKKQRKKEQMIKKYKSKLIKVENSDKIEKIDVIKEVTQSVRIIKKQMIKIRKEKIFFTYSTKKRVRELKRKKYMKLILNKKKHLGIDELEKKLNTHNSKTTSYTKFKKYAKLKIQIQKEIQNCNEGEYIKYLNKLSWFGYINKKRHEDKLLNEIEDAYGKEAIFVMGDWSNRGNLKGISTPNQGMKKLLSKRFEVYLIDEYNTSKYYHKTQETGENLKIKIKYNKDGIDKIYAKPIHSILTFKTGPKGSECINRDYNACLNMEKIVDSLMKTKKRPKTYKR